MSKRVLAILVAGLLAVGIFSAVAKAGVEGDFTFHIIMWPQGVQSEASKFDFDLEAVLNFSITISGLTLSNHLTMGIAGIENYIGSVQTILGALTLNDTFAFAKPYIGMNFYLPYKGYPPYLDYGIGYPIGPVVFVKKRAYGEITIGGLTVTNLAMFEDVNFPVPTATPGTSLPIPVTLTWTVPYASTGVGGARTFTVTQTKTTYGTNIVNWSSTAPTSGTVTMVLTTFTLYLCSDDNAYTAATSCTTPHNIVWSHTFYPYGPDYQQFRFGDIIGISGTTVSGIKVTAKTGICADWRIRPAYYFFMGGKEYFYKELEYAKNEIKKHRWYETVCTNEKLEFTKEYLAVEGIRISDVLSLDVYSVIDFTVLPPNIYAAIESTLQLFGIGQLYLWMDLLTPKDLVLEGGANPLAVLTLGPGLTLGWADNNQTLAIDAGDLILVDSAMALQNVNIATYMEILVGTGLDYMHNELDIPISFPEPIGSLAIDVYWERDEGHLKFEDIDFGVVKSFGEHNEFAFDVLFNEDGLYGADITITVLFSL